MGIAFAAIAVPVAWWLLYRTTVGFEVRTVGANPDAARYAAFADFSLYRFHVEGGHLVAGFGRIVSLTPDELREPARGAA